MYKTQGIIIKKSKLGEIDQLLTVYTKDFGKLLLKGKSVRKNQAKLKGHLELFLNSYLMVAPAKGFDIITGAETINSFSYLHKNLPFLAAAYYISELIDKLISGPENDSQIWELVLSCFGKLNCKDSNIGLIVNDFENQLLKLLGYGCNHNDNFSFIQSILNEKINSKYFLQKELDLLL